MTKITVFGEQEVKEDKKPIELLYYIQNDGTKAEVKYPPSWRNITLLVIGEYDIIFAWDCDPQEDGCVYIGHWNDGIV